MRLVGLGAQSWIKKNLFNLPRAVDSVLGDWGWEGEPSVFEWNR